ncbi:MAG: hypothetical protein IPK15_26440 [Verrucomicrobia bacterium]|nr:hypothetical protein [Verrucomicrobiota bacterium]
MKLKLKEDPKEWFKFTMVMALVVVIITALLIHTKKLPPIALVLVGALLHFTLVACWVRPVWFRGFYRAGMTLSFRVGQVIGFVWLSVFYLLLVTPLGLLLRLAGKDLLALKRVKSATSYWRDAKPPGPFERMF